MKLICTAVVTTAISLGLVATAEAIPRVSFFQANAGNIGCAISKSGARCDIGNRKWDPPPKPASCPVDWGFGLTVGRHGKGNYVCAGDSVLGMGPRKGDNKVVRRGHMRCRVNGRSVRCVNLKNQHGFSISKNRARRF